MLVTAAASLWLTPWSIGERFRIANQLAASQLTADVQPRVFAEQFPEQLLYVAGRKQSRRRTGQPLDARASSRMSLRWRTASLGKPIAATRLW